MIVDGNFNYASTEIIAGPGFEGSKIESTFIDYSSSDRRKRGISSKRKRTKREAIRKSLEAGCKYVFADGSQDARDLKELSIQQRFFDLNINIKEFILKLNITKGVYDGREWKYSHGTAYINIFINDPPENGTCNIRKGQLKDGKTVWTPSETCRALLDEFLIQCSDWVDPNDHAVNKYIFKLVTQKERGEETTSKNIHILLKVHEEIKCSCPFF